MQVDLRRQGRTATAGKRRAQIIAATIALVADEGYAQASFARIAERAGLSSTRLISYHFAGKAELVAAVVEHVVTALGDAVGARVRQERSSAGRLRAYIEGVVEFTDAHRTEMRTLLQILLAGAFPPGPALDHAVPGHVVAILRQGQADGEFRDFDPTVMALAVQRSVDALPFVLQGDPDLDCTAFAAELVTLFALATRRPAP